MSPSALRAEVLLSVQRALLGEVSPHLRAVIVDYDDASLRVTAYFDGEVRDDDAEGMSCVEAEIMADFPPSYRVQVSCVRCDAPQGIAPPGIWVYSRRE